MTDYIIQSVNTSDDFNPTIVIAIAAVCLAVVIFLMVSGKRR